jgi:YD repeat-containing protein
MKWGTADGCVSARRVRVSSKVANDMARTAGEFGVWVLLLAACISSATAQTSYAPVVITPPIVDSVDDNHVSMLSGKLHLEIPALKLGDVSFIPVTVNGPHFDQGGLMDENYGHVVTCASSSPGQGLYATTTECAMPGNGSGLQATYGEERANFSYYNGQYSPWALDGSTFADNGSTCTWTKRNGTQIVFAAYHVSGNPLCQSNNILQIINPDGRIAAYYYYGTFSTTALTPSPILGIATNSGYLLKYNYSGTPTWGAETSVVAINRAFETCDPAAIACTLIASWPTATVAWQTKMVSTSDDFLLPSANYNPYQHYTFTVTTASHQQHVMELDSFFRVISYQPPEAASPVYSYSLCSLRSNGHTLVNCFGIGYWYNDGIHAYEQAPILFDMVNTTSRNGQTWTYSENYAPPQPVPGWSTWWHSVQSPLGVSMAAEGNSTPGQESFYGPVDEIDYFDGSVDHFERNTRNSISTRQTHLGLMSLYSYDTSGSGLRGNLWNITRTPIGGSGVVPGGSAVYPTSCTNIITCNKPTSVTDPNGNTTTFIYDPTHGGPTTVTDPAVNGIQPQTRSTYVKRFAWYLNTSGVMTQETRGIWLLNTQSFCRKGPAAASGSGCALGNDEVVTSYDYGPDSGPNNLILRGKVISADGQAHRSCYGHDLQGNTIWETSPNANRSSCPDY